MQLPPPPIQRGELRFHFHARRVVAIPIRRDKQTATPFAQNRGIKDRKNRLYIPNAS
jgi:hypothetical protein